MYILAYDLFRKRRLIHIKGLYKIRVVWGIFLALIYIFFFVFFKANLMIIFICTPKISKTGFSVLNNNLNFVGQVENSKYISCSRKMLVLMIFDVQKYLKFIL